MPPMKQLALPEVKDDLSKVLRLAEKEDVIITHHGKPAGILIGFGTEDDWFDYKLHHDPRFLTPFVLRLNSGYSAVGSSNARNSSRS